MHAGRNGAGTSFSHVVAQCRLIVFFLKCCWNRGAVIKDVSIFPPKSPFFCLKDSIQRSCFESWRQKKGDWGGKILTSCMTATLLKQQWREKTINLHCAGTCEKEVPKPFRPKCIIIRHFSVVYSKIMKTLIFYGRRPFLAVGTPWFPLPKYEFHFPNRGLWDWT